MKINFTNIIVLLIVVFLTSATTASLITIKPATPIQTVVSKAMDHNDVQGFVSPYIKKGFIVKNIFRSGGDASGWCIVVMEKY